MTVAQGTKRVEGQNFLNLNISCLKDCIKIIILQVSNDSVFLWLITLYATQRSLYKLFSRILNVSLKVLHRQRIGREKRFSFSEMYFMILPRSYYFLRNKEIKSRSKNRN